MAGIQQRQPESGVEACLGLSLTPNLNLKTYLKTWGHQLDVSLYFHCFFDRRQLKWLRDLYDGQPQATLTEASEKWEVWQTIHWFGG